MNGHAGAVMAESVLRHRTVSSHFFLRINEATDAAYQGCSTSTHLLFLIYLALLIAAPYPCPITLKQFRSSVIVGRSDLFGHGRPVACRARIA
jgi:hypothetical protein